MRRLRLVLPLSVLLVCGAASAHAARFEGSAHFIVGVPQGVFADVAGTGFGFQMDGIVNLDPQGWLGLRLDGGYMNYGHESRTVPLSSTVPDILVDVNTTHNLAMLGIGPQFTAPAGPVRPYLYSTVGLGYFFTETSVRGSNSSSEPFASTTNFSKSVFAWTLGGGLELPVTRTVRLDLGVERRVQKDAEYLTNGGIIERPDGTVVLRVNRSDADLVMIRAGVTVASPF